MVVLISLEARQEPFIVVCSDVISVQTTWQDNAPCLCPVEKTAYLRHHDVLYLTVCRGCQGDLCVFDKLNFPLFISSPAWGQIQETESRTSGNEILSPCRS